MSAARMSGRLTVFLAFAALAAAAATALVAGPPPVAPTAEELKAVERAMAGEARLHARLVPQGPAGSATWCAGCHPAPPHAGSGVSAAMLNAHSVRMDCLLCHWPGGAAPSPAPSWRVHAGASAFLGVFPGEPPAADRLAALRAAATAGRRCFERGPACSGCHRPGGLGPLARPGAAAGHTASLENLEKIFSLGAGEKWYFPQIQ